jgi:hypothetical protein
MPFLEKKIKEGTVNTIPGKKKIKKTLPIFT